MFINKTTTGTIHAGIHTNVPFTSLVVNNSANITCWWANVNLDPERSGRIGEDPATSKIVAGEAAAAGISGTLDQPLGVLTLAAAGTVAVQVRFKYRG